MPIYEYECKQCGVVDIMQKVSEGTKRKCPECGTLGLKRLVSAPAFQLKGTGWYVTDFRDAGNSKDKNVSSKDADGDKAKKTESKAESKSESKSESGPKTESKSKTKSGESKSKTKKAS